MAPESLNWPWQVLPHVVTNSVDHGLDVPTEREACGKRGPATLRIAAIERPTGLVVEIEDDGRGIDWQAVREKIHRLGLAAETEDELVRALFSDGVTTREQATEHSGRGVGLAAVAAACRERGAEIHVSSKSRAGTLFRFTVHNDQGLAPRPEQRSA